ncbi:MAG: hypothetical protein RDV41_15655, partial [Planctomycetota bacterium]|nr:hypothetical protein [Planctomycetota bacterium]
DGLKKEMAALQEQEATFREILPTIDEVPYDEFYELIQELQRKAEVALEKLDTVATTEKKATVATAKGAPAAAPATEKANFKITVNGGVYQVLTFMHMVETTKRFTKVNSFTIKSKKGATSLPGKKSQLKADYSLDLDVSTYTFAGK